jgi:hypothetical protein
MIWNVYRENFNSKCIETWNVFKHGAFKAEVDRALTLYRAAKYSWHEFSEAIRVSAQYYFWSRSEHEVVITSWPPYIDLEEYERITQEVVDYGSKYYYNIEPVCAEKIDIYAQLRLNWDSFIRYIRDFGDDNLVKENIKEYEPEL